MLLPPRRGDQVGRVVLLVLLNPRGEPPYPPFTPAEMDRGSRFADAIARLVEAYELAQLFESLFDYSVKASLGTTAPAGHESDLRAWLESTPAAAEHRDPLLLWVTLREIVGRGNAEWQLCRGLLDMIALFVKGRSGGGCNFGFYDLSCDKEIAKWLLRRRQRRRIWRMICGLPSSQKLF